MQVINTEKKKSWAFVEIILTRYADRSPYFLNPDSFVVNNIIKGLVRNKLKHGHRYCPCREVTGKTKVDKINIYPCQTHRYEIDHSGTCECGLFVSEEYYQNKKKT